MHLHEPDRGQDPTPDLDQELRERGTSVSAEGEHPSVQSPDHHVQASIPVHIAETRSLHNPAIALSPCGGRCRRSESPIPSFSDPSSSSSRGWTETQESPPHCFPRRVQTHQTTAAIRHDQFQPTISVHILHPDL